MNSKAPHKKQEILLLVVLCLVLALVILVSKFVIGVNFGLMEQNGFITIGYHEVHGSQIWALQFESFTGSITSEGQLPENAERRLTIYSDAENARLTLTVECGKEKNEYILQDKTTVLSIPGNEKKIKLTLSGVDVLTGYFNAVWE